MSLPMRTEKFNRCIWFVLTHEGLYVNDVNDRGGETKFGISKRAYPDLDIKNLTEEMAVEIFYRDFWKKAGCEQLDYPMCLVVFDTAVNCGVSRALKFSENIFNWTDYIFLRLAFYVNLKKPMFLGGWTNRLIDLYKVSKEG